MDLIGAGGCFNRKNNHNNIHYDDNHQYPNNHHHTNHLYLFSTTFKMTLLLIVVGITCISFNRSTYSSEFFQKSYSLSEIKGTLSSSSYDNRDSMTHDLSYLFHRITEENASSQAKEERELERTLRKAAMKDKKTVIVTTLNGAWAKPNSIFDVFLESFRIGKGTQKLLNHVLVGALDRKAYSRCVEENLHCYAITTDGVDFSGEAHFMSADYLKMMWRRIGFLRTVLNIGYDFVFTDADIIWLRDPFPRFYPDGDIQIACDKFKYAPSSLLNFANGGFNYVKSNHRTIQFYNFWYTGQYFHPGRHDQDVFNIIKGSPLIRQIDLRIRFFNTSFMSGFCQPSKDLHLLTTMHANCCIDLEKKIVDLKRVIHDWKRYMDVASSGVLRNLSIRYWTPPKFCE